MPESVSRIQHLLALAGRRCGWLACGRGLALATAALSLGLAVATLAVNEGSRFAAIVLLCAAIVTAIVFAARRLSGIFGRLGPRAQAEAIEQLRPELRGGLFAVVDRVARPMGSPGLLSRLADQVATTLALVRPTDVWPWRPVWKDARWSVLGVLALLLVSILAPLGPLDALRLITGSTAVQAAVVPVKPEGPRALLGDITLRYLYPTYTRLEPLEVPNTSGEVRAPLGTVVEVRARTAQPWASASLRVAGEAAVPAELKDGRNVSGTFTVAREGSYRFEFGDVYSAQFLVVPDPDLAPTVAVQSAAKIRVARDARISLPFSAKDDYGITRVVLEVTRGGKAVESPLRSPTDSPRGLSDITDVSVADLGLAAGDSVTVRVGAWDNDEVSGSKAGWSSVFVIEVLGAKGSAAAQAELRKSLFDALLPALADFVIDATPAHREGSGVYRWAELADSRYEAFDAVAAGAEDLGQQTLEAHIIKNVSVPRRDLMAFARGLPEDGLAAKDLETLIALQGVHLRALEMAVWTLDKVAQSAAYRELIQLVKAMAEEAKELRSELAGLNAGQSLARLDMLSRLKAQVDGKVKQLEQGGMRSFLQSRGLELDAAMSAARRDVSKGNDSAAKADMERIADLLDEMAGGVEEAQKRGQDGGDELAAEIKALSKELEALGASQAELAARTESARRKHGVSLEEGLEGWKEVDRLTAEVRQALQEPSVDALRALRGVGGAVSDAQHDASGLGDSVSARDIETALGRAQATRRSVERARVAVKSGGQMDAVAARSLARAERAAAGAVERLQELAQAQSGSSPELQRDLQALSGEQGELAERAKGTAARAKRVAQSMPADASQMEAAAQEGADEAERAGQSMQDGDAMGALGGQSAAQSAFERAQDALQQAMQDMAEMKKAGQGGGNETGDPANPSPGSEGAEGQGMQEMSIPAPEEFETPEAYRKALLEGMQGAVPEAYRATNRRYYEELVRQ